VQTEFFNGSALILGAMMFLVVTIPLARLIDLLISRQQAKTSRGGSGGDDRDRMLVAGTGTAG
jgi:hypothetical protein